ncbi:MAG: M4 family metallopeptidase [Ruegeria sp.]|uniref:M4 family metallopeptidase n=1 Tax=Ruegeria sp. TaxID=1879320 RepID=UPI00349E7695
MHISVKNVWRYLALSCFSAVLSVPSMAAEFRDVSVVSGVIERFNATISTVAPETSEALGVQAASALELEEASELTLKSSRQLPMNLGRSTRFVQTLNGIPIWNAEVVVEENPDGTVAGIEGQAVFDIGFLDRENTQPVLTADEALARVKSISVAAQETLADGAEYENEAATLVYYLDEAGELTLSYHATFFTTKVGEGGGVEPTRPVYFIDANTGETIDFYENIQFSSKGLGDGGNQRTGRYTYGSGSLPKFEVTEQGTTCRMDSANVKTENLNHRTTGSGTPWAFTCFENTVKEINGAYSPLNDAQSFGKVVFDMFNDWYGASPLTQKLLLRVHYSSDYENAFWNGSSMTFGDGRSRFYPLVSMDVTAHEVAHGFTEQNSGLIYRNQSGGMNEAFSDMAGEAAEYYYVSKYGKPFARPMPDLETGADIFKSAGGALRYMCDPPKDGRSIGHVRDYRAGMDVHYSSGVYNKAFCILSKRSGWNVKKAFDVFVVANQAYWGPNETFQSGAEKACKAATRLRYSTADLRYAFQQVGINVTCGSPPLKDSYLFTTLRIISDSGPRGCGYSDWNCMTRLCRTDLGNSAWRGWAGCYRDGSVFQCMFECGMVRKYF